MNIEINTVGDICRQGNLISPHEKGIIAYEFFKKNKDQTALCVVAEDGAFQKLLTKTDIMDAFGGRYGYTLSTKKHVVDFGKKDPLIVNSEVSIEEVSHMAMSRKTDSLYDPIVVLENRKYYGIVTIKELLLSTVTIEVEKANESNPLTGFPGNRAIDKKIYGLLDKKECFAILYLDLDNFKAYNDAYGFSNGDAMIALLAQAMKNAFASEDFYGHVGGDDFVIVSNQRNVEQRANHIISEFRESIRPLYNQEDWQRGFIVANSRKGEREEFPIATISIAIVTNRTKTYNTKQELTEQIVRAKKMAKQKAGNSIVII